MAAGRAPLSTQARALRAYFVPEHTAADLARQADVSRQYVSAVLNGQRPPSKRLLKAAAELGIELKE